MKKTMRLTAYDKSRLRIVVGALHVSVSNLTVCRTLWRKGIKGALPKVRKLAYRYAIREHKDNRELYAAFRFGG